MSRQNNPNWLPHKDFMKLSKEERVFRYNTYFPSRGYIKSGSSPISPIKIFIVCLVVLLLTATLLRFFGGENTAPPTFTGLVEYMQDAPQVNFGKFSDYRITSSWGAFNFLRNFFNWFTSMISIGVWLAQSFINLLLYAVYFVQYLFIF